MRSSSSSNTTTLRQRKNHEKLINLRGGSDTAIHAESSSSSQEPQPQQNAVEHSNQVQNNNNEAYKPSKFRSAVFPIYGKEVNKFMLMGAIKFFVIMALTLTRDTKDTLVVTQCGAEAIAFLKVSKIL